MVTDARLALGSVQWGGPYGIANRTGPPSAAEVGRLLETAAAAGIRTIDTARSYGRSEEVIGAAVGDDPAWTVVTKVAAELSAEEARPERLTGWVRDSLDKSRCALRRPRLDVVLLHRPQHMTVGGGVVWRELLRQRDRGDISQLGVSVVTPTEAEVLLADAGVSVLQLPASLLDQRIVRSGLLERALRAGTTVFVRSIFLQGVAHLPPDELPVRLSAAGRELAGPVAAVREWCAARGLRPFEAFLGFGHLLGPVQVLLGCETAAQLEENLRSWETTRPLRSQIAALAGTLPDLPESIVNPALWPSR
jgi:aryl-alcohol dehydrogenase-like predicted oxidoreductase